MSLRELCRRHGISAHSLVVVQAQKGKWQEKGEQYRAKADEAFISHHAEKMADRRAAISDRFLDAIDEAITKFRSDLKATEKKLMGGEWVEEPVMRLTPKDVSILLDRFQVLFQRPSVISQRQDLTLTSELSVESLSVFLEATRGAGRATPDGGVTAAANSTAGRLMGPDQL